MTERRYIIETPLDEKMRAMLEEQGYEQGKGHRVFEERELGHIVGFFLSLLPSFGCEGKVTIREYDPSSQEKRGQSKKPFHATD